MQMISKSVGEGGANLKCDAALVQVMLMKIQQYRSPGRSLNTYLTSYDGDCGNGTNAAIRAFQEDQTWNPNAPRPAAAPAPAQPFSPIVFGANPAAAPAPAPAPAMKPGLVEPGDATWQALVSQTPPDFQDLRVLPAGRIVYIPGTANDLQSSIADANALVFVDSFRASVISCIQAAYQQHGIVIRVCPDGARRDFGKQDGLLNSGRKVTNAGPGESNHNFGMAVDLGFKGLRWIHLNGAVETNETPWLHKLDPKQNINKDAQPFWDVMRAIGTSPAVGLFRGPLDDHPHLQNWSDAGVDMGVRLAAHLTSSGSMKWSVHYIKPHYRYRCDLGWGGGEVEAGTASEIWNKTATLTLDAMKKAREKAPKPKPGEDAPKPLTEADVLTMKTKLFDEFNLADQNWRSWTAR